MNHFEGIVVGSVVRVLYDGAQCALMVVSDVNNYSLIGNDGPYKCKVTFLPVTNEFRFYAPIGPNRRSVLRNVKIEKV